MLRIVLLLTGLTSMANAAALVPNTSVSCKAISSEAIEYKFDLYATGHPMGGVTMFSGMFELNGLFCKTLRGFVTTTPASGSLSFNGKAHNCITVYRTQLLLK